MQEMEEQVLVPIVAGTEPVEASVPIDILRRAGADVTVASAGDALLVEIMYGVKIVADALVADCAAASYDLIVLPGGVPGAANLGACGALEGIVRSHAEKGRLYAAICAAPPLALAPWGLLNGHKVLLPLANGSEEMEAITIINALRRANANVVVASVEDSVEIAARYGTRIVADVMLEDAADHTQFDLIIVPGGMPGAETLGRCEKLVALLKKQAEANRPYGAIGAATAHVLQPHGLLMGKKATTCASMAGLLADASECENRVVVDGNVATSRSPGTAMEYAVAVVEKLLDHDAARRLAEDLLFVA